LKTSIRILWLLLFVALGGASVAFPTDLLLTDTPAQVYFSPRSGCTAAIIRELEAAKSEVLVQAYSFTSTPIAQALLSARDRGVKVEAILDKSQRREKQTAAAFLAAAGVPLYIDYNHAIAHNKIIVIDRATVITGSFNFTKAAEERNAENILILKSPQLSRIYFENWLSHREHSEEYPSAVNRVQGSNRRAMPIDALSVRRVD
jgi:phosphatidylserine/phosphatidylglycerophosphate/cardiolipin synthase-like enzyme